MRGGEGKDGSLEDLAPSGVARDAGLKLGFVSDDSDFCHRRFALSFLVLGKVLDFSIRDRAILGRRRPCFRRLTAL